MRQLVQHQAWIVLVGVVVFFTNLGSAALFDMDEALYAATAREMVERGDWVVPWFNGKMFPDKPPLMFWMMMLATQLFGACGFGTCEFAVRFPSAVCAIATALATYHIGRLLFRAEVGLWAGLIVSTSIIFTVSARAATVDSALTLAITLAVLIFVAGGMGVPLLRGISAARSERRHCLPYGKQWHTCSWITFVLMYAAVSVAVLAKGPVGLIMPVGAIGLFLLVMNKPAAVERDENTGGIMTRLWVGLVELARMFHPWSILQVIWRMRPLTAILVVGAIALPWYVLVGLRTDGRWLYEFMAKYNLGPAVKPILGHTGPFYYHFVVVLVGFFPWSVFLGPSLVEFVRRIRQDHPWRTGYVLVGCWTIAVMGFWSLVAMKLPHHILPAYPALALGTAAFVDGWIAEPARVSRWWVRNATVTLIVVGVGIMIALPIAAAWFLPGEGVLGLAGLPLVVGGGLCVYWSERVQARRTMIAFTVTSVVFLTGIFGFAVLRVDRHQIAPPLAAEIHKDGGDAAELASYRFFRESFVYYSGKPVARCHAIDDLREFLDRASHPYVLTNDEHESRLAEEFPGRFRVLTRRRRFLEPGEVVVLGPRNPPGQ